VLEMKDRLKSLQASNQLKQMIRQGDVPVNLTIDIDRLDEEQEDFISFPKNKPFFMKRAHMKPKLIMKTRD
jgi:hypothetical protein